MLAEVLVCLVVGVHDGDTLSARCTTPEGLQAIKVRVAEIDAPELRQPFGNRSRASLGALCMMAQATLHPQTRDRYGRLVARVECRGQDASEHQVRSGMAWVFDRYVTDRGLYAEQEKAQGQGKGLWADRHPTPPWQWRRDKAAQTQG